MKYEVIIDKDIKAFQSKVESKLNAGWTLEGNLTTESFTVPVGGKQQVNVLFMQAVTK